MNDTEILTAFHNRRAHYDTYLQANDIPLFTCPGCGFPSLTASGCFAVCDICSWEDDSILSELLDAGIKMSGPDLTENRINIGRILETNTELLNGEIDFDTARVLRTITFYQQRKHEIANRITGDELLQDHIWMEYNEVKKDLQMALVVPTI